MMTEEKKQPDIAKPANAAGQPDTIQSPTTADQLGELKQSEAGELLNASGGIDKPREGAHAKKKRLWIVGIVALSLVIVAIVGAGAWFFMGEPSGFYDNAAAQGQAPYKSPEEQQAELDRQVKEGMFAISIASMIEFASPSAPGKAYIENVPANHYDMKVSISLDDTNDVVFESKGLAPGTHLEDITLSATLEPGSHAATATFTAFDQQNHEAVGQAAAKIVLVIGSR